MSVTRYNDVGKINMFLMNKENETIMTDALSYLAIFFVMFSVIAAEAWLKEGEERGKEVCAWAFLGIWLIIGFGVASWLIGVLFHVGFRLAELICEKTHLPVFLVFVSPIIALLLIGLIQTAVQKGK